MTTQHRTRPLAAADPAPAGPGPLIAVAGASGHVGGAALRRLQGSPRVRVRVPVRRPGQAASWRERGVDAHPADLTDAPALTRVLAGCDAAFLLVPFDPTVTDQRAHGETLIASLAAAVAGSGVGHVVLLSSLGADRPGDTGPIAALHAAEEALRSTGVPLTTVRATHFQETVSETLPVVADTGVHPVLVGSVDRRRSLVATADVGAVVADALLDPPTTGVRVLDVLGPEYSAQDEAEVLGAALGRPVRAWTPPRADWERVLREAGVPADAATALAAMHGADEDGLLAPRGDRTVHGATPLADTVAAALRHAPETTADRA